MMNKFNSVMYKLGIVIAMIQSVNIVFFGYSLNKVNQLLLLVYFVLSCILNIKEDK